MSEIVRLTVSIDVRGDNENTPAEALHHALASLHDKGLIVSWSDSVVSPSMASIMPTRNRLREMIESDPDGGFPE